MLQIYKFYSFLTCCFVMFLTVFLAYPAGAEELTPGFDFEQCKFMVAEAEKQTDQTVYEACGFNDYDIAWSYWAPWLTKQKYPRAMYELCRRQPDSEYGMLYCYRSADLDYPPAVLLMGDITLNEGHPDSAYELYKKALSARGLSKSDLAHAAEQLGLLHMMPGNYYNPVKAALFFKEAAEMGSALSNNVMGYLSFTGDLGIEQDKERSFKFLWKAILRGCAAAEENLGVFHLERLEKISYETAVQAMEPNAFTCYVNSEAEKVSQEARPECTCDAFKAALPGYAEKEYVLLATGTGSTDRTKDELLWAEEIMKSEQPGAGAQEVTLAVLASVTGEGTLKVVSAKQKLPDGSIVHEIRPSAVILMKGNKRIIINRYPKPDCFSFCMKLEGPVRKVGSVSIKPYRLSFSEQECEDIAYYAHVLMPGRTDYVGRVECARHKKPDYEKDELLNLVRPEKKPIVEEQPAVAEQTAALVALVQKSVAYQEPEAPVPANTPNNAPKKTARKKFFIPTVMPHLQPDMTTPQARRRAQLQNIIRDRQTAYDKREQQRALAEAKEQKDTSGKQKKAGNKK